MSSQQNARSQTLLNHPQSQSRSKPQQQSQVPHQRGIQHYFSPTSLNNNKSLSNRNHATSTNNQMHQTSTTVQIQQQQPQFYHLKGPDSMHNHRHLSVATPLPNILSQGSGSGKRIHQQQNNVTIGNSFPHVTNGVHKPSAGHKGRINDKLHSRVQDSKVKPTIIPNLKTEPIPSPQSSPVLRPEKSFKEGDEVLFSAEDGSFMFGTVGMIHEKTLTLQVLFGDGTQQWAHFKKVKNFSNPVPEHEEETEVKEKPKSKFKASGSDHGSGNDQSNSSEEVTCGSCGTVKRVAGKKALSYHPHTTQQFNCRRCLNKSSFSKNSMIITPANRGRTMPPHTSVKPSEQGRVLGEGSRRSDACFHCKGKTSYNDRLHCNLCERACHLSCLAISPTPLEGDRFWDVICSACGTQNGESESSGSKVFSCRRSISSWSDVAHLVLSCLSIQHAGEKFFDLDLHLIPFIDKHLDSLHLPRSYKTKQPDDRKMFLNTALNNAKLRFLNGKDVNEKTTLWAIRDNNNHQGYPYRIQNAASTTIQSTSTSNSSSNSSNYSSTVVSSSSILPKKVSTPHSSPPVAVLLNNLIHPHNLKPKPSPGGGTPNNKSPLLNNKTPSSSSLSTEILSSSSPGGMPNPADIQSKIMASIPRNILNANKPARNGSSSGSSSSVSSIGSTTTTTTTTNPSASSAVDGGGEGGGSSRTLGKCSGKSSSSIVTSQPQQQGTKKASLSTSPMLSSNTNTRSPQPKLASSSTTSPTTNTTITTTTMNAKGKHFLKVRSGGVAVDPLALDSAIQQSCRTKKKSSIISPPSPNAVGLNEKGQNVQAVGVSQSQGELTNKGKEQDNFGSNTTESESDPNNSGSGDTDSDSAQNGGPRDRSIKALHLASAGVSNCNAMKRKMSPEKNVDVDVKQNRKRHKMTLDLPTASKLTTGSSNNSVMKDEVMDKAAKSPEVTPIADEMSNIFKHLNGARNILTKQFPAEEEIQPDEGLSTLSSKSSSPISEKASDISGKAVKTASITPPGSSSKSFQMKDRPLRARKPKNLQVMVNESVKKKEASAGNNGVTNNNGPAAGRLAGKKPTFGTGRGRGRGRPKGSGFTGTYRGIGAKLNPEVNEAETAASEYTFMKAPLEDIIKYTNGITLHCLPQPPSSEAALKNLVSGYYETEEAPTPPAFWQSSESAETLPWKKSKRDTKNFDSYEVTGRKVGPDGKVMYLCSWKDGYGNGDSEDVDESEEMFHISENDTNDPFTLWDALEPPPVSKFETIEPVTDSKNDSLMSGSNKKVNHNLSTEKLPMKSVKAIVPEVLSPPTLPDKDGFFVSGIGVNKKDDNIKKVPKPAWTTDLPFIDLTSDSP